MPSLGQWPRWAVLQALIRVRYRVAHGDPSLTSALHYSTQRLTEHAWGEMDKVLDGVFFDLAEVPSEEASPPQPGESAGAVELRDLLRVAKANARLPWESPEGLTRGQLVAVLTLAVEHVRRMPATGHGPMFPVPLIDRSNPT